ncbi:BspA family leucine-rich repeat surface protein [Enterococcus sp. DIV1283b]|uniref:BspA family leucine-rich repeat surface protein n=1 Tax=Enterococcus sp. DIV1283b TaxID=2774745 RepID=UPI003847448F
MKYKKLMTTVLLSTSILGTVTPLTTTFAMEHHSEVATQKQEEYWKWSMKENVITLDSYVGKSSNVVIPTAKDLGYDGATVEISADVLKEAAKDAQTLTTSNNGDKIIVTSNSLQNLFYNNDSLYKVSLNNLDTRNVTNMMGMFAFCRNLTTVEISEWDVSNVVNMCNMFWYCTSLKNIGLTNWNTMNLTDMSFMFAACVGLENLDLSKWNVSKVNNMNHLFFCCEGLISIDLSNWNTENVTDMTFLFYGCLNLNYVDLNDWKINETTKIPELFVTTEPTPLLVRASDERLKKYNFSKDNRTKFGTLKIDTQYGSFNGKQITNLFDYTTQYPLTEWLIKQRLEEAKNSISFEKSISFVKWECEGTPTTLLEKSQSVYNAHVRAQTPEWSIGTVEAGIDGLKSLKDSFALKREVPFIGQYGYKFEDDSDLYSVGNNSCDFIGVNELTKKVTIATSCNGIRSTVLSRKFETKPGQKYHFSVDMEANKIIKNFISDSPVQSSSQFSEKNILIEFQNRDGSHLATVTSHSLNKKEQTYGIDILAKSNETKATVMLANPGLALKGFYSVQLSNLFLNESTY